MVGLKKQEKKQPLLLFFLKMLAKRWLILIATLVSLTCLILFVDGVVTLVDVANGRLSASRRLLGLFSMLLAILGSVLTVTGCVKVLAYIKTLGDPVIKTPENAMSNNTPTPQFDNTTTSRFDNTATSQFDNTTTSQFENPKTQQSGHPTMLNANYDKSRDRFTNMEKPRSQTFMHERGNYDPSQNAVYHIRGQRNNVPLQRQPPVTRTYSQQPGSVENNGYFPQSTGWNF